MALEENFEISRKNLLPLKTFHILILKVDESSSRKKIPMVESGMRGALARALDNRAKVLGRNEITNRSNQS